MKSPFIPLAWMGAVFTFAVFQHGAVSPKTWNLCACALALLAVLYPPLMPENERPPALSGPLKWLCLLLPGYIAFQLLPVPLTWLRVLSPAKARIIDALGPVISGIGADAIAVHPSTTLQHLIRLAGYLIVFLLARQLVFRFRGRAWLCALPIVAAATAEALAGMVQYANFDAANGLVRGTYINRDHFAFMLELAFPFVLVHAIASLRRGGTVWRPWLLLAGLAAIILVGIVSSFSRMGVISALCSLVIAGAAVIHSSLQGRIRWTATAGLALLLLACTLFAIPNGLTERFDEFAIPGTAAIDRRMIWSQTLRVVADYPWFGCGMGGYQFTYLKYKTEMPLWTTDFAHNDYLQGFAELGIVGGIPVFFLLLLVLRAIGHGVWKGETDEIRSLALACAAALAAILMHSFVDFNLYIPANAVEAAWICGIAVALPDVERAG